MSNTVYASGMKDTENKIEMPKSFVWLLESAADSAGEEGRVEKEMGNPERLASGYFRAEKDLLRLLKIVIKNDSQKSIELITNLPTASKDRVPTEILQYLAINI